MGGNTPTFFLTRDGDQFQFLFPTGACVHGIRIRREAELGRSLVFHIGESCLPVSCVSHCLLCQSTSQ